MTIPQLVINCIVNFTLCSGMAAKCTEFIFKDFFNYAGEWPAGSKNLRNFDHFFLRFLPEFP